MKAKQNHRLGSYVVSVFDDESVRSFVPPPLPPAPAPRLEGFQVLLEQANQALGRLDGLASVLPDLSLFIYGYVRKEAVLSSQIEGTQSSLSDLLLFENQEAPGAPIEDVKEVSNMSPLSTTDSSECATDSRSLCVSFARFTASSSRTAEAATKSPANFAEVKTGSAARVRGMPRSSLRRLTW